MLLLWNSKKVFLQVTRSISYSNRLLTVCNYLDVCYLIKLLINETVFYEQLRKGVIRSNLSDLFANGSASLIKRVLLTEYITSSRGNWVFSGLRSQKDNDENDMTVRDRNVNVNMVERQGKEIEIDYN